MGKRVCTMAHQMLGTACFWVVLQQGCMLSTHTADKPIGGSNDCTHRATQTWVLHGSASRVELLRRLDSAAVAHPARVHSTMLLYTLHT